MKKITIRSADGKRMPMPAHHGGGWLTDADAREVLPDSFVRRRLGVGDLVQVTGEARAPKGRRIEPNTRHTSAPIEEKG